MSNKWDANLTEMEAMLAEARKASHTRLFALAYDRTSPLQWHHRKDEKEMQDYLDSRDRSESIFFNCAVAVVVVNPADSDETIEAVITSQALRNGTGPGYFGESF